jgi:GNAT superfamily N-acetyltransferase
MQATISLDDSIETAEVVDLYESNAWSSARKPEQLLSALRNSHALVTARMEGRLLGLGNAISDGALVVYFPHFLVHPAFHRKGIGRGMMEVLLARYRGYHQLMLTADGGAIEFYRSLGFERAGRTEPMWIYAGGDH